MPSPSIATRTVTKQKKLKDGTVVTYSWTASYLRKRPKLTDADDKEMARRCAAGEKKKDVATAFGITYVRMWERLRAWELRGRPGAPVSETEETHSSASPELAETRAASLDDAEALATFRAAGFDV